MSGQVTDAEDEHVAGLGARVAERKGDWICTFTGRRFWPLDPRAGDFDIADIAHALAYQCRFNGHTRHFYSIAQHSVHVMQLVQHEMESQVCKIAIKRQATAWGLLHDAPEAYCCDMPRPLKVNMPEYRALEWAIQAALCQQLQINLTDVIIAAVKWADNVMLYSEAHSLMPRASVVKWHWPDEDALAESARVISPWTPSYAEQRFRQAYQEVWDMGALMMDAPLT